MTHPRTSSRPRRAAALLLAATIAGCGAPRPAWTPPERPCPGALRPVWMADRHYTICVPTSFRTQNLATWWRERGARTPDVLAIQFGVSPAQLAMTGGWPPRLAASDSLLVVARVDTVAGVAFETEVGRRTVADGGWRFVAGVRGADGQYIRATGESADSAALDTLLVMLHSVARSATPDPNRRE